MSTGNNSTTSKQVEKIKVKLDETSQGIKASAQGVGESTSKALKSAQKSAETYTNQVKDRTDQVTQAYNASMKKSAELAKSTKESLDSAVDKTKEASDWGPCDFPPIKIG